MDGADDDWTRESPIEAKSVGKRGAGADGVPLFGHRHVSKTDDSFIVIHWKNKNDIVTASSLIAYIHASLRHFNVHNIATKTENRISFKYFCVALLKYFGCDNQVIAEFDYTTKEKDEQWTSARISDPVAYLATVNTALHNSRGGDLPCAMFLTTTEPPQAIRHMLYHNDFYIKLDSRQLARLIFTVSAQATHVITILNNIAENYMDSPAFSWKPETETITTKPLLGKRLDGATLADTVRTSGRASLLSAAYVLLTSVAILPFFLNKYNSTGSSVGAPVPSDFAFVDRDDEDSEWNRLVDSSRLHSWIRQTADSISETWASTLRKATPLNQPFPKSN